jgi:hypothetical protein
MNDGPEEAAEQLVADITILLGDLGLDITDESPLRDMWQSPDGQLHQNVRIEFSLRFLTVTFDLAAGAPLALWQFWALLGGGIRRLLARGMAQRFEF